MSTISTVERLTFPMGPAFEFIGFSEPQFAETTDLPTMPRYMKRESSDGTVFECDITTDAKGRFVGASLLHQYIPHTSERTLMQGNTVVEGPELVVVERGPTTQIEVERTWKDERSFEDKIDQGGTVSTHAVDFLDENAFQAVTTVNGKRDGYYAERHTTDEGHTVWVVGKPDGTDAEIERDEEGRLLSENYWRDILPQVTSYEYDEAGKLTMVVESDRGANGHPRVTTFDQSDPSTVTAVTLFERDLVGWEVTRHYNEDGLVTDIDDKRYIPTSRCGEVNHTVVSYLPRLAIAAG